MSSSDRCRRTIDYIGFCQNDGRPEVAIRLFEAPAAGSGVAIIGGMEGGEEEEKEETSSSARGGLYSWKPASRWIGAAVGGVDGVIQRRTDGWVERSSGSGIGWAPLGGGMKLRAVAWHIDIAADDRRHVASHPPGITHLLCSIGGTVESGG